MHFDRQLLYLVYFFAAEKVSGLAIPDGSRPTERFASVSSNDSVDTTRDATGPQTSYTETFLNLDLPTGSRYGRLLSSADPRIIDSASRAASPSLSYDTTPKSIPPLGPSDLRSILGSSAPALGDSRTSSSILPTITTDPMTYLGSHHELRQLYGRETASGPTGQGETASGPTLFGATLGGPTLSGETASGPTASGALSSGPTASGAANSGGPVVSIAVSSQVASRPVSSEAVASSIAISASPSLSSSSAVPAQSSSSNIPTISSTSQTSPKIIPNTSHHSRTTVRPLTTPFISHPSPTTDTRTAPTASVTDPTQNGTHPNSAGSHPITNASVAGIASGLTAGAVLVALGGVYLWRRKKQGKPLFGARGSTRSTGSFYPKSAWLYDPEISPNHSRSASEAGQNLIPAPRPDTVEMEAGLASPDMRPSRSSSPLLPPAITISSDGGPSRSSGDSPRRSGGRRSRPMMSINEEDE